MSEETALPSELSFLKDLAKRVYSMKVGRLVVEVEPEDVAKVVDKLEKAFGNLSYYVSTIEGTDFPIDRVIRIDYYIYVVPLKKYLVVRTKVPRDSPEIASLLSKAPGVLSGECETYDLLGVVFKGNEHLKRAFFVPEDVVKRAVYPLRKDSKV